MTFGQAGCPALATALAGTEHRDVAGQGGLGAACGHGANSARAERAERILQVGCVCCASCASYACLRGVGMCIASRPLRRGLSIPRLSIIRLQSPYGLCIPWDVHRQQHGLGIPGLCIIQLPSRCGLRIPRDVGTCIPRAAHP